MHFCHSVDNVANLWLARKQRKKAGGVRGHIPTSPTIRHVMSILVRRFSHITWYKLCEWSLHCCMYASVAFNSAVEDSGSMKDVSVFSESKLLHKSLTY